MRKRGPLDNQFITFEEELERHGSIIFTNVGVSMRPLIREGKDVMHIKRAGGELKKYDVVLFVRPNVIGRGHYVLHRIIKMNKDGSFWIVGDNCLEGETVSRENIIGVLDAVVRNGKTVKSTDFSYRLYVIFWSAPYHFRFFTLKLLRFAKRAFNKLRSVFSGEN